jgi:hypothetical protein
MNTHGHHVEMDNSKQATVQSVMFRPNHATLQDYGEDTLLYA